MSISKPILLDETGRRMASALEAIAEGLDQKTHTVYGFHIDGGNSDPDSCVTYLRDAVGMTPAKMDFTNDVFDYGSWGDAFFMPKPCMLKYNGEVDYYLDPDNYAYRDDGVTASDVGDSAYAGNAMMEWGQNGKKIWMKIVPDSNSKSGSIYFADHQADDDFHAYSFINSKGVMVDHFYTPIYNGTVISSKLRSISGQVYSAICQGQTAQTEMNYAHANNPGVDILWETEVFSDIQLINALLVLIGKSTDTQSVFGKGRMGQAPAASNMLGTGTMDAKGLFWGYSTDGTHGVKVFGMENWWGNQWRRYAGHVNDNGVQYVKHTYGKQDGSNCEGYIISTTTGAYANYKNVGAAPGGTNGGYMSEMLFSAQGMMPKTASGSSSTYYCDGLWFNNSQVGYARRGGACNFDASVGAFYCSLYTQASYAFWYVGASVSCKPLA